MNSLLRILVTGVGSIGKRHLKNLYALGETELAFADPGIAPEEGAVLQQEIGAKAYRDFDEALKDFQPGIVFICSPTQWHVPQAIRAARARCHLFIEKPISFSTEGI